MPGGDGFVRPSRSPVLGGKRVREVGDGVELDDAVNLGQLEAAVGAVELLPGPQGEAGPQGPAGEQGPAGPGVAVGGTAGQVLSKVDGTDFNTVWIDPPSSAPPVFARRDQEKTGVHAFVGLEEPGGGWKVYRRTLVNNTLEYATGGSGYLSAWASREVLTYA